MTGPYWQLVPILERPKKSSLAVDVHICTTNNNFENQTTQHTYQDEIHL